MNQNLQDKKIAVIGVGGVGGYLAGRLIPAFPHVTLVARGDRGQSIAQNGLILHSQYHGEITAHPERVVACARELEPQDYIFLCVKNYSLQQAIEEMRDAVTENTVIIPVMNGVDVGERVRALLGRGIVVDSLIYIVAYAKADYSVFQQGGFADVRIGIMHPDEKEQAAVRNVADILSAAGIDFEMVEDIEREIWRKYILNCAYNVATAAYDNTIGQLRDEPEKEEEYGQLVWEAYKVARAKGVHVTEEHARTIIGKFYEYDYEATSSLQRDVREGRQSELDVFSGYLVREAHRLGVSVPVSEKMYEILRGCDI